MRFYPQFPDLQADVQWYFVEEGTPDLGRRTVFGSLNWEGDPKGGAPLGEVYGADRVWVNGGNPTSAKGEPPACGSDDQWRYGDSGPPSPATAVDLWGTPLCCARKSEPFSWTGCGDGRTPMWTAYLFDAGGIGTAEDCPQYNGRWRLTYIGGCQWRTWTTGSAIPPSLTVGWRIIANPGQNIGLTAESSLNTTDAVYQITQGPDEQAPLIATLLDPRAKCIHWPTTLVLFPEGTEMPLIGTIVWDAGVDAVPAFHLECNGQAVSRAIYSLLFGRLGITFGAGDGATTFNLPDLRDRTALGKSAGSLGSDRPSARAAGDSGGNESVTLAVGQLPAHTHSVTDPTHSHSFSAFGINILTDSGSAYDTFASAAGTAIKKQGATPGASTGISLGNTGSGNAVPTQAPWLCLRALIYAGQ